MEFLRRRANPVPAVVTEGEAGALATYNSEVARGLMHKSSYRARMAEIQERYDRWLRGWEVP
jgi:hypothetical protein